MATLPWPALIPAEQRGNNQVMSKKKKNMGFSKYEENVYQSVLQSDAKIRF